jgi:molybdate transport system ATP-binding protein
MLTVAVQKRLGETLIDVAFAAEGCATALFGPSGAGKTSVVQMIAGLVLPDRGRIALGGEVLFDAEQRISVPAHKRRIGYVFQEGRLFPHLSVRMNLAYGRWMNGFRRDRAEEERVLDMLGIGHLLRRRPGTLSGGEKQRVAIGRALLLKPRLLLLDEPLASLDEARKAEILPYLERLRDEGGVPLIYVSHTSHEVRRLAETIVHLASGKVNTVERTPDRKDSRDDRENSKDEYT